MDSGSRSQRGSVSRRLGASSYLLELLPDGQTGEVPRHNLRLEGFPSQFQLSLRPEDARHNLFLGAQSLHWGGKEERLPPAAVTKCRLSRSKRRPLLEQSSSDMTTASDRVIFAESPIAPGVPVVYRPPEERAANPDRLNLDRRHLTMCPILEGEDRLRLLNLQHNAITRLQHLSNLRRLVFLDLYDNLIHEIAGLEGLLSLRVLMLGKNRIRKISGLQTLLKLDVVDLHGNMIRDIEGLGHLAHLRVLNLAGNEITCVSNLTGLQALTELNLRRNRITQVYEVDVLPNLQRLFLSHNLIQTFDDIACLSQCDMLSELTLDGNPLANAPDHRQSTIFHIRHLWTLDQRQITEEERREAVAVAREEEERAKELQKLARLQDQKAVAIAAIRKNWEATHQLAGPALGHSASTQRFAGNATLVKQSHHVLEASSLPQLLPMYFVDHCAPSLHLYGAGSLEVLDTPLHSPQPVTEIHFHCIEFDEIAPWLPKLAYSYSDTTSLSFECTNLAGLEQVNALAQFSSPLHSLTVSPCGNPITEYTLFFSYAIFRLLHLGLTQLNNTTISPDDVATAESLFGHLGEVTVSCLPRTRLLALVSKHRSRSTGAKRTTIPGSNLSKRAGSQQPLTRIALHHYNTHTDPPDTAQQMRHAAATSFCSHLLSSTLTTHSKRQTFEQLWPQVVSTLVHQALQEFGHFDKHMKNMLDNL